MSSNNHTEERDLILDETSSTSFFNWHNEFLKCEEAMKIWMNVCSILIQDLKPKSKLIATEDALISLAATGAANGIFYCNILEIEDGESTFEIARFFEHGSLSGFGECNLSNFKDMFGEGILPYFIFTEADIKHSIERNSALYKNQRKNESTSKSKQNFAFHRKLFNKTGLDSSIRDIFHELESLKSVKCKFLLAFCLHATQTFEKQVTKAGKNRNRFYACYPETYSNTMLDDLMAYRSNPQCHPSNDMFRRLPEEPNLSEQFLFFSSLPNFHKWVWNSNENKLKFEQRFPTSTRYYPGSPRNRILNAHFFIDDPIPIIEACVANCIGANKEVPYKKTSRGAKRKRKTNESPRASGIESTEKAEVENSSKSPAKIDCLIPEDEVEISSGSPSKDNCLISEDEVEIDSRWPSKDNCLLSEDEVDDGLDLLPKEDFSIPEIPVISDHSMTVYQHFCYELFARGIIRWRVNKPEKQVLVMNNYHAETGNFLENEFVHVTADIIRGEEVILKCGCLAYATSMQVLKKSFCCHVMLLKEILVSKMHNTELQSFVNVAALKSGILCASSTTILLSSVNCERYSVVPDNGDPEFVTVFTTAKSNRRIVSCQSRVCQLSAGASRNVKHLGSNTLCPHLTVFREYFHLLEGIDPVDSDSSDEEIDIDPDFASLPNEKWNDVFDEETGMWKFEENCISKQGVSSDPNDLLLRKNMQERRDYQMQNYEPGNLCFSPPLPNKSCGCEAGWFDETLPEGVIVFKNSSVLYLSSNAINVSIYSRKCVAGQCVIEWDGADKSIFRYSRNVCAGYEIGWKFVDLVMHNKGTFRGFVNSISNDYERIRLNEIPFMSLPTFINWFFAWASAMKVDFREQCDWCGERPQLLACDGTKIGIGFKETFVPPIETPDPDSQVYHSSTRRYDRTFIANTKSGKAEVFSKARQSLYRIAANIMNGKTIDLTTAEELREFIPVEARESFDEMVKTSSVPHAKVFKLLASDSSIDSVVPLKIVGECSKFLDNPHDNCSEFLPFMRDFSPEFCDLISLGTAGGISLLAYCVGRVTCLHNQDLQPDATDRCSPYNPPKYGRAYYFHPHGAQIRKVRKFKLDDKNQYDEAPYHHCSKKYPSVTKKGVSFLFLWFCPTHGHCYGYHIIPGSEGRKDPATSLYAYLEEAPESILYDFACSLSEYCHNRESGYFAKTRFFHDVFHSYNHKCSHSFRCQRLNSFNGVNSSICEQFNSFLQNIKASAKLMSQVHFSFYVQFFIGVWNQKKRLALNRRINILNCTMSTPMHGTG